MLHTFLTNNRRELIDRCRAKAALRTTPKASEAELDRGIPIFLDQLIRTLAAEQSRDPMQSRKVSGPSGGGMPVSSEIGEAAALHGRELLLRGFTVDQVVHDYGDLCQAITGLAFELDERLENDEFRTLNRCLDNGIAGAVTEFVYQRDALIANKGAQLLNERIGVLAHELRNLISSATLAFAAMKSGNVGMTGATGAVLDRSMQGLRNLIDRSLAEVRIEAGLPARHARISVADLIAEAAMFGALDAQVSGIELTVAFVDPTLAIDADRDLVLSAIRNLLQNAFKFTKPRTDVLLRAYAAAERVLIEVEDNCGGLAAGQAEKMFLPFTQGGPDKTGLGLGLSIARRSVEACDGTLSVQNVPARRCIFTISLPRYTLPTPSLVPDRRKYAA